MESTYVPPFLYLSLGFWFFLFIFFVAFCFYLIKLPNNKLLDYKAKAIENKKRLKIKTYKF